LKAELIDHSTAELNRQPPGETVELAPQASERHCLLGLKEESVCLHSKIPIHDVCALTASNFHIPILALAPFRPEREWEKFRFFFNPISPRGMA
jgi:hypothetical protein